MMRSRLYTLSVCLSVCLSARGQIPQLTSTETLFSPSPTDAGRFGESVMIANLDGATGNEVIVGAPSTPLDAGKKGFVFVFRRVGLLWQSTELTAPRVPIDRHEFGNNFGVSLAAGDVNGDGAMDLVVGSPGNFTGLPPRTGLAFVLFGPWSWGSNPPYLGGSAELQYPQPFDPHHADFGFALVSADLDIGATGGDQAAEIVVGARRWDDATPPQGEGACYIFGLLGQVITGTVTNPQEVHVETDAIGVHGFGGIAIGVGDFDLDATSPIPATRDLILGASHWNDEFAGVPNHSGLVRVYRDRNWQKNYNLRFQAPAGPVVGQKFGDAIAVADFDGDGFDDVAIGGASQEDFVDPCPPGSAISVVYVLRGGDPYFPSVWWKVDYGDQPADDGINRFGRSLAWGDLNGDQYVDLIVGDSYRNAPSNSSGVIELFLGADPVNGTPFDEPQKTTIQDPSPSTGARFGWSIASGPLGSTPKSDLVVGSPGFQGNVGKIVLVYY